MNYIMSILLSFFVLDGPPKDSLFKAVYYSDKFIGKKTKSSEIFSQNKLTCASNYYIIGDSLKITNQENNKSVIVKVNDSGSFKRGTLDLSKSAFKKISSLKKGKIIVKVEKIN